MLRLTFTDIEKQALAYERTHHPHPRVRRKMDVLWLKSQGLAHQNIARLSGVCTKTMRGYFRDYIEGGIEGLKVLRFRRPQSALVAHQQTIESYFRDHPPASINEAIAAIGELTGLTRSPTQVRRFLKDKCAMKRLKTGGLPAKADPAVQATFKEQQLEPRLAQAQAGTRSVFFVDAAHFVLGAFMSVLWCVARVWIKAPSGRQRFNVLGALNAVTKEVITVVNSTYINSHCVCELLEKLAAVTPKRPITVVLDNARYQRCALVQTRADALNIELLFLPAYSPNLNLIERLWKFVKKQCLYAKHYPDFGAFTSAIQRCLRETLTSHKEALSSCVFSGASQKPRGCVDGTCARAVGNVDFCISHSGMGGMLAMWAGQSDGEVAQAGHHGRTVADADPRSIFVEGDITHVLGAVLDTPLPAVEP